MMRLSIQKMMAVGMLGVLVAGAGACNHQTREEAHNAANDRWSMARGNVSYSLAQQQFDTGDLDKAERSIEEALNTKPDEPAYHDLAARISIERGELERAYRQLEHSIGLNEERHEPHYLQGVVLQQWQRYEQALEAYETAFEHRPDRPAALQAVAEMLVKLNRPDEAVERLEERLEYFANNAAIRTTLGRIYMMDGRYAQAASIFREATVLSPQSQYIREQLAKAEFARGEYGPAIHLIEQLMRQDANKGRTDLLVLLGDAYMATHQPVQARRVFLELTQEDSNNVNIWIKLGQAAWMVEDRTRLDQAASRVVSLAPRRYEGHLLRGMLAHLDGDADESIDHFANATEYAPTRTLPWILKGMAQERAGDREGAEAAYRQALELSPEDTRAQRLLAGLTS